ncbi:MAG: chromosomal replication initiator protein DnaA [Patescibacteria group bacterium]|nr:chromosomal replication initiator protein DnaA [Patescibacteria group bacterium]MCL5431651.1 chromosomal replication initiator protein DnaA [Patescibacteria group bacterium]
MIKENLDTVWKAVLGELEVDLGKANFGLYFKNSELLSLENGVGKIGFPNQAISRAADQRYYVLIQEALQKAAKISPLSLVFEVVEKPAVAETDLGPLFETPKVDKEAVSLAAKRAGLRVDYTLEEFCVSTSNQLAFAAAQAVAQKPGQNYNPLFLWGGVGVGKTHLMQAIGHELLRKNSNARVVYASGETFTNEIIAGIRRQNTADFKEKYRSAEALLIDDVQFLSGKDTAQEEFFYTFNAIQQHEGQIIMTCDRKPADIKDLTDRLRSRFEGGLVADISTPDSELKTTICILKAKKRGVELSTIIAAYIADNVNNIRSLDGAVQSVVSTSQTTKQEITLEFVAKVLKFPIKNDSPESKIDARRVLDEICSFYTVPIKSIKSHQRDRPIARPRQILMYFLRKHTTMTLDEVADFLGGRDHTTILHGVKNIETLIARDASLKNDVDKISQKMGLVL